MYNLLAEPVPDVQVALYKNLGGGYPLFYIHKDREEFSIKGEGIATHVFREEEIRVDLQLNGARAFEEPTSTKQRMEKAQRAAAEGDVEEYKPLQTEFGRNPSVRPNSSPPLVELRTSRLPSTMEISSSVTLAARLKERLNVGTNTSGSLGVACDDREDGYDTVEG
ncbi:hypothetical protein V5O48_013390 [Marasmius crinis-equi]|uniref:Uncharacterized protein n=1 Tax=Marasmius crinis-equi TaxID=585013 RepID=A0ABR3F080_9AGAR